MAEHFQEEDVKQSQLKIGDTVLLYAREVKGYVFSELTRYLIIQRGMIIMQCMSLHAVRNTTLWLSAKWTPRGTQDSPTSIVSQ